MSQAATTHIYTAHWAKAPSPTGRMSGADLIRRVCTKAADRALKAYHKALHTGQPSLVSDKPILCTAYFGNVLLDLYGTVDRVPSGVIVDLHDAAIHGTQISLCNSLTDKQWEDLHAQALDAKAKGAA